MNVKLGTTLSSILLLTSINTFASVYPVPPANKSIIGQIQYQSAGSNDTVVTLTQKYDVGYNSIEKANPEINMAKGFASGTTIKIPTQHLLPDQPREGIVVNLPEMRMYYYVPGTSHVVSYPIGIGKIGKTIPITRAVITKKVTNPSWVPPDDIREFVLSTQGIAIPQVMPAGPDNPLGPYAIYMSIPTFLIHSTIFPESIGKRASFGCLRMYEKDIQDFFPSITSGIPVVIVNSPVKVGWQDDKLYMEAHTPLEEHSDAIGTTLPGTVSLINDTTKNKGDMLDTLIDWQAVAFIEKERDGLPHDIGIKLPKA